MNEVGSQPVDAERQIKAPLIIGVGASPAALDSIERFFAKLTVGVDQAVVLALQHHEATDEARLRNATTNPSIVLQKDANLLLTVKTVGNDKASEIEIVIFGIAEGVK